jgi:hypothetical protein
MKYCYGDDDAGCRALPQAVNSYWDLAYNVGAVPGYFGAVVMLALVLLGKTHYTRWTAAANPAVLMLLSPLADRAAAPFGAVLSGGIHESLDCGVFSGIALHHVEVSGLANVDWHCATGWGQSETPNLVQPVQWWPFTSNTTLKSWKVYRREESGTSFEKDVRSFARQTSTG